MTVPGMRLFFAGAILIGCVACPSWGQEGTAPVAPPAAATPDASAPLSVPAAEGKQGNKKGAYTGPKTIIVLPPTPMLDENGEQRKDPQGAPLFNPGTQQKRDKHGNPEFDDAGKPVMQTANDLGYNENGKKIKAEKEKAQKSISTTIQRGTYTVDGLTAKAGLNYEISDLRYVYFYVPWIGVTVVSHSPFPGAKEQKDGFNDRTLTVTVEDQVLQLTSDARLLGKKPESAYVLVDRNFRLASKSPAFGFGSTLHSPYMWPPSKDNEVLKEAASAPPLPVNLREGAVDQACPEGQARPAAQPGDADGKLAPCRAVAPHKDVKQ